jgi:hypothetical protein
MYRMGREGLDLLQAPVVLDNGHQNHLPDRGDIIIYNYGYNDIQKSIWEHGPDQYVIISKLVQDYTAQLVKNNDRYITVVQAVPPPPWSAVWHGTEILGTREKKYHYTVYMNTKLRQMCVENGFHFFDGFYNYLLDPINRCMSKDYASDGGHVDSKFAPELLPILEQFLDGL